MSIKSTHIVTREFAMAAIMSKLYHTTDEQLADILEIVIHNSFYNFTIVEKWEMEENKSSRYPSPYLDDLNYLPYNNTQ